MSKFIQLAGIPASGKTTLAREISEGNEMMFLISSDEIRKELFNSVEPKIQTKENHRKVFEIMYERTVDYLNQGFDVVYDATNTHRKQRIQLLQALNKDVNIKLHKEIIYVQDNIKNIYNKNNNRENPVPNRVITQMYKRFQIPIYSEGWNEITIHNNNFDSYSLLQGMVNRLRKVVTTGEAFDIMDELASHFEDFANILHMEQDSTYHKYTVSEHTFKVYEYVLLNWKGDEKDKEELLWTALLHDIGKHYCKSFIDNKGNKQKYARFIGHELVGSQIAVDILSQLYFDRDFIYKVATLVQFHMYLLNEKASREKLMKYVGSDMYDKLVFLREADAYAH